MPPRIFDDLTPAQIDTVESWLEAQAFELGAFRTRISALLRVLGFRSHQLNGILRRQRPDLWQALNRAREVWRNKLYAVARAAGTNYDMASVVHISPDGLRGARRVANSKREPPWGKPPSDEVLDKLDANLVEHERACWPPMRPFPIMEAYSQDVGKPIQQARLHMEYHRPDLYKRYATLRVKFDAAFDKACLERAPTEDIADWFETTREAVYARRKKLGIAKRKKRSPKVS
jgi:hypothetical protein